MVLTKEENKLPLGFLCKQLLFDLLDNLLLAQPLKFMLQEPDMSTDGSPMSGSAHRKKKGKKGSLSTRAQSLEEVRNRKRRGGGGQKTDNDG